MPTDVTTTTPNMSLVIPTSGASPGPLYANDVNTAFTRLDAHDHTSGYGVKVPPSGLNIASDLDFQTNNAINLGAARLKNLTVLPAGGLNLNQLVDLSGDLWWTNNGGTNVQITAGGTLNSAALVSSIWANVVKAVSYTILPSDTFIVVLVDDSAGARTITLPTAASVASGRYYEIHDYSGNAGTNNVTVATAGGDTIDGATSYVINQARGGVFVMGDGVSKWIAIPSSRQLNGASVPAAGALTTGNVLQVTGASALGYAAVNLAGGAAFVTGVLPAAQVGLATVSQSGGVQLTNDLSGTAIAPVVIGVTATAANPFTLGSAGPASIALGAADVRWAASIVMPQLGILARTSTGAPTNFKFYGQDAYAGAGATAAAGGNVSVKSGASFGAIGGDTNVQGAAYFDLGGSGIRMGVLEVVTSRAVCALGGLPATADLGANTGNIVTWLRTANVVPTAAPTTGTLLYSNAGVLGIFGANLSAAQIECTFTISSGATAGAGGAPPAAVSQYLAIKVNGTVQKIPLYNN